MTEANTSVTESAIPATTPPPAIKIFDPNNIIIGDKEITVYVETIARQLLSGTRHLELRNRGFKGRQKLFQILEAASADITFKTTNLVSVANTHEVKGKPGLQPGMDNSLILDI